jgi:protein-disulfide isomerase
MERILNDIKEGKKAGVTGTPGNILLNNKTGKSVLVPGAQPYDALESAINDLLSP